MSNFRDDVEQVRADAARGDLAALEAVLHNANAERAARLTAANLLARAGQPEQSALLSAARSGSPLTQLAAVQAYLRAGDIIDGEFLIEMAHSTSYSVRRAIRRQLRQFPGPENEVLRLRCYLPSPFYREPDPLSSLEAWVLLDGVGVVTAIGLARYTPAISLLITLLDNTPSRSHHASVALYRLGDEAIPALLATRPQSAWQANAIGYALRARGYVAAPAAAGLEAASSLPLASDSPAGLGASLSRFWKRLRGES